MAANPGLVTVFGASGFLGRYVVRALTARGWRVRAAVRNPHTSHELKVVGDVGQVQLMQANVRYPQSIIRAVDGADAVVNLVGVLFESGRQTFDALHAAGPDVIGEACAAAGISNLAHVSAIGADADSKSDYARSKGEGEALLREHVPSADILRPSILFGAEDEFFNRFAGLTAFAPALPLIGGGKTKFQPVFVEDVANAVAMSVTRGTSGNTYELGGPQTYTFKALLEFILETIGKKRLLAPVPWFAANMMGFGGELTGALPFVKPFLTRDQVENLKTDNVAAENSLGFSAFGIRPETIESIVPTYLSRYRKYGQFYEKRQIVDDVA
ncbi:MAG: complex I NDUFA9 subunit family protein [Litorimonas sp.]